ncbi:MAG: hypothetical protein JOZ14_06045 [Acidobacteria bacterium]|nr:hypothetical protein [Acidobacteriota bacterium]
MRYFATSAVNYGMMALRGYAFYLSFVLVLTPALVSAPPALAQAGTRRLILKDGSYQLVNKWELQGDRVHYYSVERSEWEDVPSALIDWAATNQFEKDRQAGKTSARAMELKKELEAERQEEELKSPHVAPGLRLPSEGGVYVLDTYLSEPQLVALDQSNGEVNRHVGRNVLRAAINPVAGTKHTIELAGPSAKVQVHASLPAFYVNLEPDEESSESSSQPATNEAWDRFRVVRVQVKGDKRIVGAIKTAVYGKVTQEQQWVATTAEQLGEGWVKVTPQAALEPGEYALAEMLGKEGMNSYVWDFGLHPNAPANLAVIRPDASELKRDQQDGLKQREQP